MAPDPDHITTNTQVSTLRKKKNGKKAKALQGNRGDAIGGRLVNPLGLGGQLPQVRGVVEKKQH